MAPRAHDSGHHEVTDEGRFNAQTGKRQAQSLPRPQAHGQPEVWCKRGDRCDSSSEALVHGELTADALPESQHQADSGAPEPSDLHQTLPPPQLSGQP